MINADRRNLIAALVAVGFPRLLSAQPLSNNSDTGKQLRQKALLAKAKDLGLSPSAQFPRVFGVVMDWPVGDQVATVVALSDGTASLYTTSSFGIIGGQAHEPVRAAGRRFIGLAERQYSEAVATATYPYPTNSHIYFYLLTYNDVRLISADLATTQAGTSNHTPLFVAAQEVLTHLRGAAGK